MVYVAEGCRFASCQTIVILKINKESTVICRKMIFLIKITIYKTVETQQHSIFVQ